MRISFELEEADLARFHAALAQARRAVDCADEVDIIEAAKYALDHLPIASAPAYVRKQMAEVQTLIAMLEDEAWALPRPERDEVLETLLYLSDPDDLIPDHIEVIGLLDDAIMLELLLHKLRVVRRAYADFRERRTALRLRFRLDKVGKSLCFREIHSPIGERTARELSRLRFPQAWQRFQTAADGVDHRPAAMAVKFDDVLASRACRSVEAKHQRFVEQLSTGRVP